VETSNGPLGLLTPPVGWGPIAELCQQVASTFTFLEEPTIKSALAELPPYMEGSVPVTELETNLKLEVTMVLRGLAERRDPDVELKELVHELCRKRAIQGAAVDTMYRGLRADCEALWNALVRTANLKDERVVRLLLVEVSALLWKIYDEMALTASEAFRAISVAQEAANSALKQRLVERLLTGDDPGSSELAALAETLGFDPGLSFQAFSVAIGGEPKALPASEHDLMKSVGGVCRVIPRGHAFVMLVQGIPEGHVTTFLERSGSKSPVGVGMKRSGMIGAKRSLVDAGHALLLAFLRGGVVRFVDEWPAATILAQRSRLTDVLPPRAAEALSDPILVASVRAYADAALSLVVAGQRLHVHPNTIAYRLGRWREITGWDPRTLHGLMCSMLAIECLDPSLQALSTALSSQ
jgi:hypothetical protein